MMSSKIITGCLIFLIIIIVVFACLSLGGVVWMLLWNYVLCYLFTSLPVITFWQGMGIAVLWSTFVNIIKIIFGKKNDVTIIGETLNKLAE